MTRRFYARATAIAAASFAISFAAIAVTDPLPRVVWNASASAPIGLYRYSPTAIRRSDRWSRSHRRRTWAAGWRRADISVKTCRC
jgi:hypothetical protein